ncbi:unnamed protein product [Blepharisma stoltei]|uniref:Uncharacterized protein n=1 Tax=Blepharisma stoltei TaxID=1481888 RepID=A0AAU9IST6_9CILI|nr:unnamed protein product [Blepharisma stoltei]
MSEELKKAVYILATINQHIKFPFKNPCLSKIFQNAFTSGIDNEDLRLLEKYTLPLPSFDSAYHIVKDIIRFQKWEDIFAWPNKLLQPFQVSDIPKKIQKVAFFCVCTNKDYIEEIEGYNLIVKLVLPEGILQCKYWEEWKSCSSSQEMDKNSKPKIYSAIFGFVKNWGVIPKNEETAENEIEKVEDEEARIEKIEDNPQYFEENDTKNINADQINEKFKQIEELSKCKQSNESNESLQAELIRVKIENKKACNDISEIKAMIEDVRNSLNEKIDETNINLKKV